MSLDVIPWNGKPITKPGFYSGVPMKVYHSGELCRGPHGGTPTLTSSLLRTIFMESEAHFYDKWILNPDRNPDAEKVSDGMILGRAAHHLMLGQEGFAAEFVVTPERAKDAKGVEQPWSLRFDSAKAWVKDRQAEGRTVLSPEQVERIKGMADRLRKEPLAKAGAMTGLPEITVAWRDRETGIWLLSRPDVIPTHSGDFTDLKTIGKGIVSYGDLVRTIAEHGYHQQAALCAEGYEAVTGEKLKMFNFYFIETSRPYCARMVALKDSALMLGMRQNRNAINRFVRAMNTGFWPGPGGLQEAVQYIDLSDAKVVSIEGELRAHGEREPDRAAA